MFAPPALSELGVWSEMPASLRVPRESEWSRHALDGRLLGSFLEGPAFDDAGNLHVLDIPFGRIFRIGPGEDWNLVTEYPGWPNGMKFVDGAFLIADHRLGLVRIASGNPQPEILFDSWEGKSLLGLNDLAVCADGAIYVTDQGTTGMHDPAGRVFRLSPAGQIDCLIDNGPSPNGIVTDATGGLLHVAMTRGNAIWRVPLSSGKPVKVGIAIQLSGGVGPDGLALDPQGNLLVAHPPLGIWHFNRNNLPVHFYAAPAGSYPTNLVIAGGAQDARLFVTDSFNGRILSAPLAEIA